MLHFNRSLSTVVRYSGHNKISKERRNILSRGKLACTDHSSGAIRVVFTYSEKQGAIVARADLRSDTHLRERPRTKIKPCHCAGIQTDPAIVRVYQSNLAIVQVY